MAEPKVYDPKQISIIIGVEAATGYANGSFVNVVMESPVFNVYVDAHGNTMRSRINNNNATVTLTLSQASKTNDTLTTFYTLDKQSGTGTFPFVLKDNLGTTIISSLGAWVNELPEVGFGDDNIDRTWTIYLSDTGWAAGGLR